MRPAFLLSALLTAFTLTAQAAWYMDRDNSMSPVSTDEGVGAAMATFWTLNGFSQGVQVCPGVYLATAHGVLDDPRIAAEEGREVRGVLENSVRAIAYPMNKDNMMRARGSELQFVSPRLKNSSNWDDLSTDYVFVRVDNPVRPNNFIRPVEASNNRLIEASRNREVDVSLYRPLTRFNTDASGLPDFNENTWAFEIKDVAALYQEPQKVNQTCDIREASFGLIGHSCPSEQAISGSPLVTNVNNQNYLLGLHAAGDSFNNTPNSFSSHNTPNDMIQSAKFCEDYESVCGQPCVNLDDVLADAP